MLFADTVFRTKLEPVRAIRLRPRWAIPRTTKFEARALPSDPADANII